MKIRNLLTLFFVAATLVGCGTGANTSSGSSSTGNPTSSSTNPIKENSVKIRSINASETSVEPVSVKARNKKEANDTEIEDNYIIITKDVTDVQFTITLDNPEAYGIDALRVTCDDPEAQIQVEGEWKPISQEANGTRVVNWSSEDPYEKTYNIRTTSLEDLYTFKVVDIRLSGHDTFLSKQSNSTDFGNNELDIYKMDTDAYELDVVSNTFEEIKFGIKVKEGVTNLSNFKVDGKEPNEEGYWVMNESKEDCKISYDFELENGMKVRRESRQWIGPMEIRFMNGESTTNNTIIKHELKHDYYYSDETLYIRTPNISSITLELNDNIINDVDYQISSPAHYEYSIEIFDNLLDFNYLEYAEKTETVLEDDYSHHCFWWYTYYPYLKENLEGSSITISINNSRYNIDLNFEKEYYIYIIVSPLKLEA